MAGHWEVRGDPDAFESLREEWQSLALHGDKTARWVDMPGGRSYWKGGPLLGKASLRHAMRRWFMRQPLPRLREFDNLRWLRSHGLGAAEPLVAGAYFEGGRPRHQLLSVREVAGAVEMGQALKSGTAPERARALVVLATDLARMHALGFVHRDLFPRNVLWRASDASVHFIDAWRGGPGFGLRGPTYDLGCWLVFAVDLLTPDEVESFLSAYAQAREAAGSKLRPYWTEAVRRERRAVVRRVEKQRRRGSDLPEVRREW